MLTVMGTIAVNDRITDPVVATAGQTDFAVDFEALTYQGAFTGLFGTRLRAGITTALSLTDFEVANAASGRWTARLLTPAQAGDVYQFYSSYPVARDMAWSGGAFRTETAELDMAQRVAQLQELRRDVNAGLAAIEADGVPATTPLSQLLLLASASVPALRALLEIPTSYVAATNVVTGSAAFAVQNSTAIQAWMGTVSAAGGGILVLPAGDIYIAAPLDNKYPHVLVTGASGDIFHDSGSPVVSTRIIATQADWMAKLRTPYAAEQGVALAATYRYSGSGFKNLSFDGGAVATGALLIDSVACVEVDVYAKNLNAAVFFKVQCGVTGVDLGEACDVQHSRLVFRARAIDTAADQAASILTVTGSTNANVNYNLGPGLGIWVLAEHKNGRVFLGQSCDNNEIWISAGRVAGGAGETVRMSGATTAHPGGGQCNTFRHIEGVGAVIAEGTDTAGVTAGVVNRIEQLDTSNGTPSPTAGTGSLWRVEDSDAVLMGSALSKIAVGDSAASAKAARGLQGAETVRVFNGASDHVLLDDGVHAWGVNIDAATGDLRMVRVAGAGAVNVGNGAPVKLPGFHATASYANDAAAAGGGVPVDQLYRNGSVVQVRVA